MLNRTLCALFALIMVVILMPQLSVRAEGFTYTITASGAASGLVTEQKNFGVMEGQYIKFTVVGSEAFELDANIYGLSGTFSCTKTDVSTTVKEVTVRPVNGASFNGNNRLYLTFRKPADDPDGIGETITTNDNIFLQGYPFTTRITIRPNSLILVTGETYQLEASADPQVDIYGRDIEIEWEVEYDTGCINISESGLITAVAQGADYISASSKYTNSTPGFGSVTVVNTLPAQSVTVSLAEGSAGTLSNGVLTLVEGETAQLAAAVSPYNSTDALTWAGGNDCASLDNGKINALKKGSAEVTASAGEKSQKITVKVLEHHDAVGSTCKEKGSIEYWDDADGNLYDSKDGITPIDDISAPLAAHSLSRVDAIPAGCETEGSAEHYKCAVCGSLFDDSEGTNKIDAPEMLPALGHDYGDWHEKTAPTVGAEGIEERVCSRDSSHTETRAIPAVTYTYTADGYTWTLRSGKPLSVTINRSYKNEDTFALFADKIEMDENVVEEADYTAASGSLKVLFKASYLNKLSAGKHTMKTYFTDGGYATTTINIKSSGSGSTPGTGDDTRTNDLVSGMILFTVSLSFVAYTFHSNKLARAKLLAAFFGASEAVGVSGAHADVQGDGFDDITPEEPADDGFDDIIQ